MSRSRNWCFTWNNYDDAVECYLCGLEPAGICEYLTYGREAGSMCGTPHLQGFIRFPILKSFELVRTMLFGAHVEAMRETTGAAIRYCQKDGDIEEFGKRPMDQKDKGQAGADMWDAVWEAAKEGKFEEIPSKIRIKHMKTIEHINMKYGNQKPPKPEIELKEWQEKLCEVLNKDPTDREIHIVVDPVGGAGKSTFASWLMHMYEGVEVFRSGKSTDLAHILKQPKIAIFDFARSLDEFRPWSFVEQVKDGTVWSPKYESCMKYFPRPHVIVFTNSPLEPGKLSQDRPVVWELSKPSASSPSWI